MSIPAAIQSQWAFSASGTLIDAWRSQDWGTGAVLTASPQRWTLLAIHPKILRLDMNKDLSISKSAENSPIGAQKGLIRLKRKD